MTRSHSSPHGSDAGAILEMEHDGCLGNRGPTPDREAIEGHLQRVVHPARYLSHFDGSQLSAHLRLLAEIKDGQAVAMSVSHDVPDADYDILVAGVDQSGAIACVTGCLAALGLTLKHMEVTTLRASGEEDSNALSVEAGKGTFLASIVVLGSTEHRRPEMLEEELRSRLVASLGPLTRTVVLRAHTEANTNDELIGEILDGRFRIERRLSSGGMADVYLAYQVDLDRACVVKILRTEHIANEEFIATFNNESKLLARIDCPQVVNVYGCGVFTQRNWIALEYLPLGDAAHWVERFGVPSVGLAVRWLRAALRGLKHLHEKIGIIHCDLKPNNLLIDGQSNLKIADLGLSRFSLATIGSANEVIGTPLFMAPEQARGEATDERSDLFSLGSSFFYILTGQTPCGANTSPEALAMIAQCEYRFLGHDVPASICSVVNRLMQAAPSDRYQTAAVALSDLDSYMNSQSARRLGARPRRTNAGRQNVAEAARSTRMPQRDSLILPRPVR
jgi:tRNA A-37 threonylcarbamoyl transferase component Bud32